MSISQFSRLSEKFLQSILLKMNYDNIQKICLISNDFKSICQYEKFWRAKFIHDYGFSPDNIENDKIKEYYINFGSVYVFGKNNEYNFGNLYTSNILSIGSKKDIIYTPPKRIKNIKNIKNISRGVTHTILLNTILLNTNNEAYVFGSNKYGQLGLGDNIDRDVYTKIPNMKFIQALCGQYMSIFIIMLGLVVNHF